MAAFDGKANPLRLQPTRSALVVLIDGLGHAQLAQHRGHARALGSASGKSLVSGFPSTTAAALTSLATGTLPGSHGIVGYDALVPGIGVRNQLRDWGGEMDPDTYQRSEPLWSKRTCAIVAEAKYAASGFTRATLRGADYIGEDNLDARVQAAAQALRSHELVYLYLPELDRVGHKHGVGSNEWVSTLEMLDAHVGELAAVVRGGMLVTADHGMVDVPTERHIVLGSALDGVKEIAGEARARQFHLEDPDFAEQAAKDLREEFGDVAWAVTRSDLVSSGWLGEVDPLVLPRIGDVLLAAKGTWAFYPGEGDPAMGMVGQHGSLTDEELRVPLARFGVWSR
ncbi:alkaline phosphatase family protein [uncultured Agrococcus sp.]|uniref:alkaline phosphatase family protein n=1 Tax=uncultured Agrococcus sp. TaxID=382258 RepID=UPI0025D04034|nr:nucleotide pyrophosphatase/phosphodiesterase family protein [uncultured Agrococcus sp.]